MKVKNLVLLRSGITRKIDEIADVFGVDAGRRNTGAKRAGNRYFPLSLRLRHTFLCVIW